MFIVLEILDKYSQSDIYIPYKTSIKVVEKENVQYVEYPSGETQELDKWSTFIQEGIVFTDVGPFPLQEGQEIFLNPGHKVKISKSE